MTKRILYNTVIQNPFLMRMVGLEPTRSHLRKILSLVRLPFRHIRIMASFYITCFFILQAFFTVLQIILNILKEYAIRK